MSAPRLVEVSPERLGGWVARFAGSHGGITWTSDDEQEDGTPGASSLLRAADGSWARLTGWGAAGTPGARSATPAADGGGGQEPWLPPPPPPLLLVLVRRGGYAVAVASSAGEVLASKVGTRHVQSRTAAGGWSQQRYARRRAHQADALVEGAAGHAVRVLGEGEGALAPVGGQVGGLVLGGDRTLAAEVLDAVASGPLARLHGIPRRELWDLPDPRRSVLQDAVRRGRAVLVEVHNA